MKLYVSDLDGTLLRNDATLSDYSRDGLNAMIDSGLLFTVASACGVVSMRQLLAGLRLRLPVIEMNGALISHLDSGEHLTCNDIDWHLADRILELSRCIDRSPFYFTLHNGTDHVYPTQDHNEGIDWYLSDRARNCDPRMKHRALGIADRGQHQLAALTYIDREPLLRGLRDRVEAELGDALCLHLMENDYIRGWFWLTIQDRRARKHLAVKQLMSDHVGTAAELVAFGDNHNDLEMLQMADRGFAVANAVEPVRLSAVAVIDSNEEDAVVRQIEKEFSRR